MRIVLSVNPAEAKEFTPAMVRAVYDELTKEQVKALSDAVAALSEPISKDDVGSFKGFIAGTRT